MVLAVTGSVLSLLTETGPSTDPKITKKNLWSGFA
jgi:hypothetical protein